MQSNLNLFTDVTINMFFFLFQLLQNLGKADKTTDEIFEEHLINFNQQQANATRLQKDISNYIRCIKGISIHIAAWCQLWNLILLQLKFRRCLNEQYQNIFFLYLFRQFESELSKPGHFSSSDQ